MAPTEQSRRVAIPGNRDAAAGEDEHLAVSSERRASAGPEEGATSSAGGGLIGKAEPPPQVGPADRTDRPAPVGRRVYGSGRPRPCGPDGRSKRKICPRRGRYAVFEDPIETTGPDPRHRRLVGQAREETVERAVIALEEVAESRISPARTAIMSSWSVGLPRRTEANQTDAEELGIG